MDVAFIVEWLIWCCAGPHDRGHRLDRRSFYFIWPTTIFSALDPADAARGIGARSGRSMAAALHRQEIHHRAREAPPELHWFKWEPTPP